MKKLALLSLVILLSTFSSFASHIISAEITYTHITGNDYEITLTIYRDCSGISASNQEYVTIQSHLCGDTTQLALPRISVINGSQACPSQTTTCNGGTIPGAEKNIYRAIATLPPCTDWKMTWNSCCRNSTITNLATQGSTLAITTLNNVDGVNNNSPYFQNTTVPYFSVNSPVSYNHGTIEADGDSIYYSKIAPLENATTPYNYNPGYSVIDQVISSTGFNLNSTTGDMTFTPSVNQVSVITTFIEEFRNGVLIGTQYRDLQVTVAAGSNQPPNSGPSGGITITYGGPSADSLDLNTVGICPNDTICIETTFSDPNGDNMFISTNIPSTIPGATWTITNNNTPNPIGRLCWRPTNQDVGPNVFNLSIEDDACPIKGIQSYSFSINVNGKPFAGPDNTLCLGDSTTFQASGGDNSYTWYDVATNTLIPVGPAFSCNPCANPNVTPPLGTNSYYVASSQSLSCQSTDTIVITVNPNTVTPPVLNDTTFCEGLTTTLDAGSSYTTYDWVPSGGNTQVGIFDTVGTYAVVVSDGVCDAISNYVNITEIATPQPYIIGSDSLCSNKDAIFTFDQIFNNPTWTVGPNTYNTDSITLFVAGAFNLELTIDSLGCVGATNITVLPLQSPVVTLDPFNVTSLCQNGTPISLPTGSPIGGVYSGSGVSGSDFDPNSGNIGVNNVIYTYTSSNSCSNSDTATINIDACVGINETNSATGISIYPNPNNGIFTFEKSEELNGTVQIIILDVNSKLVFETTLKDENNSEKIDISNYNSGIYFVKMILNNDVSVMKIIKE